MPGAEPGPEVAAFPDAFGLVLDAATSVGDGGRVLVGGSPRRVLRLSAAGGAVVAERLARGPVAEEMPIAAEHPTGAPTAPTAAARLARRLVDAGVAHPVPPPGAGDVRDVTVVIPVRDRAAELARCLRALGGHPHVLVVDDGSVDAAGVRAAAEGAGAELLRRDGSGGPAAARNTALPHVRTPLVAFLDSDCVPPPGWLAPLVAHLEDPAVAAVAPRVRGMEDGGASAERRPSTVARWGAARSPLDLGPRPARVVPGTAVSFVPTAALVVRRSVLGEGFDPALRHGEDVDLVWRLHDAGHRLRYEPAVVVGHDEPGAATSFLVRRFRYGTSAGPLARRHGDRLAPLVLAPRPAVAAGLLLAGRPRVAALLVLAEAARAERGLRGPGVARGTGARAALRTAGSTLDGLSRSAAMFALPPLVGLAVARPAARLPVAGLLVGAPAAEWVRALRDGRTAGLDPVRWVLCGLADDVAYGSGVWAGAVRSRAPRAVLPKVVRTSGPSRSTGPGG
ncbi:mycofactocin biosynthesis glycosyltransferase MftF [Patulibacter sp.]|uniref:mycofactocin biosynthesis glycosyltransferase MftF n=1 Tax=Patulibacter sp. TaxID=1912859 RepID=UPI002718830A|nr:mycofactocin biosynthesis glycosyltransferase MftF [Patulibacter sp.]MDO9407932.1 mycofactocin biosynthesis glycosyltransferase MftF [Patulibacter sp.]